MKKEIRKRALKRRDSLPEDMRKEYDRRICEEVRPFLAGCVMSYRAIGSEPDLSCLDPECSFAYPKVTDDGMIEARTATEWSKGPYGIMEPAKGEYADPGDLDVILVPLVAFDEKLHRLGHGKGYYDRFLKNTKALKIGIAYEIQKEKDIPVTDGDVPMDLIITEEEIYRK